MRLGKMLIETHSSRSMGRENEVIKELCGAGCNNKNKVR